MLQMSPLGTESFANVCALHATALPLTTVNEGSFAEEEAELVLTLKRRLWERLLNVCVFEHLWSEMIVMTFPRFFLFRPSVRRPSVRPSGHLIRPSIHPSVRRPSVVHPSVCVLHSPWPFMRLRFH